MAKEQWGSRLGVILAVAGSAVGLGNFLRFPGQAAQYGGGAFMIPYFVALLLLGIPLCWAEWTMGRYGGVRGFNSAPGIYRTIWRNPLATYCGAVALLVPLIIYMYYVLIEAWCLGYAFNYLTGDLVIGRGGEIDRLIEGARAASQTPLSDQQASSAAFGTFFNNFVGTSEDGFALEGRGGRWQWVLVAVFALNFVLIYRGVNKGIELLCRYAMPLMAVLAMIVLVRVLTLGTPDPEHHPERSVLGGLNFMWDPDFSRLADPATWLAAAGQIFFTLSVGFGIVINYASYLNRKDDVALSGLTSSSVNEFFEVCLGGLITIPAAFVFLELASGGYGTFDLGFKALPNVFNQMPGGPVFGFLWFLVLFFAAITSSVSMLQPVIAFLEEGFGLKRHASVAMLGLITAFGVGFVLYFSKGLTALDTLDFWVGQVLIFILAMFQAVLYGWVLGIQRGERELHEGAQMRVPRFVQYVLKYVTPVYMLGIFALFCAYNVPSHDAPIQSEAGEAFVLGDPAAISWQGEAVPDEVRRRFQDYKQELPEKAVFQQADGGFEIRNDREHLAFVIRQSDGEWTVLQHSPGYIEKVANEPVAMLSVAVIAVVVVFLLLLVHIARRRWERDRRFAAVDAEPESTR